MEPFHAMSEQFIICYDKEHLSNLILYMSGLIILEYRKKMIIKNKLKEDNCKEIIITSHRMMRDF